MKPILTIFVTFGISIILTSCHNELEEPLTGSGQLFKQFWTEINDNHAMLQQLPCSWKDIYITYLPKAEGIDNIDTFAINIMQPVLKEMQDVQTQVLANYIGYSFIPLAEDIVYSEITDRYANNYQNEFYIVSASNMLLGPNSIFLNMISQKVDQNKKYLYIKPGSISYGIYQKLDSYIKQLKDSIPRGIIFDCRHRSQLDEASMNIILSYFIPKGNHLIYDLSDSKIAFLEGQYIEGNGKLQNMPIAIIVDGMTSCETNTLIYVIASWNNVATVGYRPSGYGGYLRKEKVLSQGNLSLTLKYPVAQLKNKKYSTFSQPIVPQIKATPSSREEIEQMNNNNTYYDDYIWKAIEWIEDKVSNKTIFDNDVISIDTIYLDIKSSGTD